MKASEIKKLLAEPNVERIELRPDGTVVVYAKPPIRVEYAPTLPVWPYWTQPVQQLPYISYTIGDPACTPGQSTFTVS